MKILTLALTALLSAVNNSAAEADLLQGNVNANYLQEKSQHAALIDSAMFPDRPISAPQRSKQQGYVIQNQGIMSITRPQVPFELQTDVEALHGGVQQSQNDLRQHLIPQSPQPAPVKTFQPTPLEPYYGNREPQLTNPPPTKSSQLNPLEPYYGNVEPHSSTYLPENPIEKVWQLYDIYDGITLPTFTSMDGVGRVILLSANNPNVPAHWQSWYRRFMHMVYSNLQHLQGAGGFAYVWVRNDGTIKVNLVSDYGSPGKPYFPNEDRSSNALCKAILSLQALPEIRFVPDKGCDTVMLRLTAGMGERQSHKGYLGAFWAKRF